MSAASWLVQQEKLQSAGDWLADEEMMDIGHRGYRSSVAANTPGKRQTRQTTLWKAGCHFIFMACNRMACWSLAQTYTKQLGLSGNFRGTRCASLPLPMWITGDVMKSISFILLHCFCKVVTRENISALDQSWYGHERKTWHTLSEPSDRAYTTLNVTFWWSITS